MGRARITCIFCQAVVSADKNLNKYKKHLEIAHDIFYHQDMVLTLAFLSDEENQTIVEKLMVRVDYFLAEEIMGTFENIFTTSDRKDSFIEAEEDVQTIEEENIASIQHILQGDLSDSEDEEENEEGVDDPQPYPLSDAEEDVTEKTDHGFDEKIEALKAEVARRMEKARPMKNKNEETERKISSKSEQTKNQSTATIEEIYRFLQDSGSSDEESETPSAMSEGSTQKEKTQDIYNFLQDSEESSGGEDDAGTIRVKKEPTAPLKTEKSAGSGQNSKPPKHDLTSLLDRVVMQTKQKNQKREQQLSGGPQKKRRL